MKKLFLLMALSIFAIGQMWAKDYYTFDNGTTIYIDCRDLNGKIKIPKTDSKGYESSQRDAGTVYAVTINKSGGVKWDTDATFVKPQPTGKSEVSLKFKIPGTGDNCVLVASDGQSYTWTTYDPNQPSVSFDGLTDPYYGQQVVFAATAANLETPVSYAYYIKKGAGEYGAAITEYTFNDEGDYPCSYTVKVVATGANSASVYTEKTITCSKYTLMQNNHTSTDKGSAVAVCSSTDGVNFNAVWTCPANEVGTAHYFYVTKNTDPSAQTSCDFLYSNREITETSSPQKISLYGNTNNQYNHSWLLTPTRAGDYTFTLTLGSTNYFDCEFPPLVDPTVSFSGLSSTLVQGQNVVFAATSENVENPAYTFYVKQGEGEYGAAVTNYTFDAAGSYTVKVEVREEGATGDALATATKGVTVQAGHIFTEGTTIYIDFTQVSGGVNFPYNDHQGIDYDSNGGGTVKTITFTSDVTWLTSQVFIKTSTGNWQNRNFIVPGDGQNYITVPAEGNSFTWSIYDPYAPSVAFDGLPAEVSQGQEVTFAATSQYVSNPTYTFYVKKGEGEYGSAVSSYTFNEGGTYTVKVEVRENGAGDALAYAEQNIGCTSSYTVYFRNTVNWGSVWVHLYTNDRTFGNNGIGSKNCHNAAMTLVDNTTEYYEYTYQAAEPYTKVCFTRDENNNYDNFHNNECSWSDAGYDAANGLVLWTPDNNTTSSINSCTYYNTGTWTTFAPGQPNVAFVGLSSTIAKGSHVVFEAEAINVTNPTYRFYVKQGEGEYGEAVTAYDFNEEGAYTIKVEVRSNDAGEALATAEQAITCAIVYTVYFKNTMNWTNVYVHFYSDDQSFGNNGVGGNDALLQAQMEQVGSSDIYKYEYNANVAYTKICFTLKEQFNYGQFHNNECSWSEAGYDATNNMILWVPNGVISHNINSCPYFDGQWFVYPSAEAAVAFISLPAEVENGQAINLANYIVSVNVADPAYTFYAKQGTDAYAPIANPYTFPASGTYMLKVEVRENGAAGDALAYDEAEITVPLIATNFFLAGTFNSWSTEANCFRKATVDAEEATTKITVNEYSNITFKVVESGGWIGANNVTITKDANSLTLGEAGQGDNIHLTPYAAGDYIFTLNLNSRLLTVTYPDGEPMPVPVNLYAAGQFNNWASSSSAYKFTAVGDVATLTLQNLEANHDYEFKLVYNDAWLGANYTIKYHYNWEVPFAASTSENAVLKTFKGGDYILSYNLTSGLLTVTYPTEGLETKQVEILAQADGYATFYSNKGWDYPSEVEAYYVSGVDDNGSLTMVPLLGYIPAWVPVILHATPDTYTFYECDDETWIDGNMLKGTIEDQTIDNAHVHYIMTLSNNVPGLYWPYGTAAGVGAFENKGGKAYLEVPANMPVPAQVSARRGFPFSYRTPTAIENIESQAENAKLIRNGQLFILREGKIYNAQGARVQ